MINKKNILIGVTILTVIFSTAAAAYAATSTTDVQATTGKTNIMSELSDTQRDAVMQARAGSMKEAITQNSLTAVRSLRKSQISCPNLKQQ